MEEFGRNGVLDDFLPLLEKAAVKGHEESLWILNVVKNVETKYGVWKKAFAATGEPLGWYFAGSMCDWATQEQFEFFKLSADGGSSWGQLGYAYYFREDGQNQGIVGEDNNTYVEWLVTATNQHNPKAMDRLGQWFFEEDCEAALRFHRNAAELGWKDSMVQLYLMLYDGDGGVKDLRNAVVWSVRSNHNEVCWELLDEALLAFLRDEKEDLECDFDQLCYTLGWAMYWYDVRNAEWIEEFKDCEDVLKAFANRCVKYYCACVEMQQKSIFTFLWCWNRTTGVKPPGQMIAKMVWGQRADNLVKIMLENVAKEPKLKRMKL
jgi:TPR repeat protein